MKCAHCLYFQYYSHALVFQLDNTNIHWSRRHIFLSAVFNLAYAGHYLVVAKNA